MLVAVSLCYVHTCVFATRFDIGTATAADIAPGFCKYFNTCEKCHGDCDTDADCARDFRCFRRFRPTDLVPGCATTSYMRTGILDYCYDPKDLPLFKMGQVGSATCPPGLEQITTETLCTMAISRSVTNSSVLTRVLPEVWWVLHVNLKFLHSGRCTDSQCTHNTHVHHACNY